MSIFDQSNVITTRNSLSPFNPMISGSKIKQSLVVLELSQLADCNVNNETLVNGEILSFQDGKWGNIAQIPISNIPDIPQSKITNFLSSIGNANGLASLYANGKLNTNQIPSLAIETVTTVQTVADRNNLINVDMGDIALVINDSTSSNNGSYIYNGSGWST